MVPKNKKKCHYMLQLNPTNMSSADDYAK